MLHQVKAQTEYGFATFDENESPILNWESKLTTLAMMGGISDVVSTRLQREGKFNQMMKSMAVNEKIENVQFSSTPSIVETYDNEADFTSCRLFDIPSDFAWGVATAAYQIEEQLLKMEEGLAFGMISARFQEQFTTTRMEMLLMISIISISKTSA